MTGGVARQPTSTAATRHCTVKAASERRYASQSSAPLNLSVSRIFSLAARYRAKFPWRFPTSTPPRSSVRQTKRTAYCAGMVLLHLLAVSGCGDARSEGRSFRDESRHTERLTAVDHASPIRKDAYSATLRRCRAALYARAASEPSFALYTHLLLLDGAKASDPSQGGAQNILTILTDSRLLKKRLGRSGLIKTPHGVAYQAAEDGGETHRDQVLGALAQCNVPLEFPILVDDQRFSLRDLLNDSIANFHLKREELAWTADAYVSYLPDAAGWTNKYGVTYRFDDLASSLLNTSLSQASCGGLHVVGALTHILKAHRRSPIISNRLARSIEGFLDQCLKATIDTQHSDGSWSSSWTHELTPGSPSSNVVLDDSSPRTKLVVTGHLLEWIFAAPIDGVPEDVTQAASKYLAGSLQALPSEDLGGQFCPVTHAILALQN
jgi:hypothetical protein